MMTPSENVTTRVDWLEGEVLRLSLRLEVAEVGHHRWVRRFFLGLLLAVVLVVAGGAALLPERTSRMEVVGPNNDVRIAIGVDPITGSAGLEVFGVNGQKLVFLGTSREGLPNLAMYDPTGQRIVREIAP